MRIYTQEQRQAQAELYNHISDKLCYLETLKISMDNYTGEISIEYVSIDNEYYYDFIQATPEQLEDGQALIEVYKKQAKQVITSLKVYEFYDM